MGAWARAWEWKFLHAVHLTFINMALGASLEGGQNNEAAM